MTTTWLDSLFSCLCCDKLNLVCAGIEEQGMDYEDLILSLIANRLDYLMTNRPETIGHILELVDQPPS